MDSISVKKGSVGERVLNIQLVIATLKTSKVSYLMILHYWFPVRGKKLRRGNFVEQEKRKGFRRKIKQDKNRSSRQGKR